MQMFCLNILHLPTKPEKKLSAENLPQRHASETRLPVSFRSIHAHICYYLHSNCTYGLFRTGYPCTSYYCTTRSISKPSPVFREAGLLRLTLPLLLPNNYLRSYFFSTNAWMLTSIRDFHKAQWFDARFRGLQTTLGASQVPEALSYLRWDLQKEMLLHYLL